MDESECFDACIKVAEFYAGRWDARRRYEWSLSLAIWALLAAAIAQFRTQAIPSWVFVVCPVVYIYWMNNMWWSNFLDRRLMKAYRERATIMLLDNGIVCQVDTLRPMEDWFSKRPILNRVLGFAVDWAALFQMTVTLVLTLLVYRFCQYDPFWRWWE